MRGTSWVLLAWIASGAVWVSVWLPMALGGAARARRVAWLNASRWRRSQPPRQVDDPAWTVLGWIWVLSGSVIITGSVFVLVVTC